VNGEAAINGSIKLMIFDLNNEGKLIQKYVFSESEASLNCSFLNDLVIDLKNSFAYITDSGLGCDPEHGAIIAYNLSSNSVRRVLNQVNSTQPHSNVWPQVNGEKVLNNHPIMTGADGIALTPDTNYLFYCPLTARDMYMIPTQILRNWSISQESIDDSVVWIGPKKSAFGGLAFSNEQNFTLYQAAIELNGILKSLPFDPLYYDQILAYDDLEMVWPDCLGFDHRGSILFTSNKLYKFIQDQLDFNQTNYRIWSVFINAGSYMDSL